ncbi:NAD-dependent epimerase/dehydratase family protein [Streptomyces sp. NPDC001388]|uniref:NAD-dependent epimerase/dehydratase family protein n=1 Tax=Streptomyces sp. NPDC001388 TaxID=3364568 RepID=UPI0036A2FACB
MKIVGTGFLAGALAPLEGAFPDVVAVAAGVSGTGDIPGRAYAREAELVHRLLRECLREGRKLLFLSTASAAMYSDPHEPGRESGPVFPVNAYGRHKLGLEAVVAASGADHLILRLSHVVGPGQPPHQLLPALVRQLRSGRVRVHRGAWRDLVDVADVVTAVDRLVARGTSRTVVNVASGAAVPVELIVDHLAAGLGVSAVREYADRPQPHRVCVDRLHRLVPELASRPADEEYARRVLDAHLPAYR